jgi:hypothetical protein
MRRYLPLAILVLAVSAVDAGEAPASCSQNGCDLKSDLLVFAEGDPAYEVTGQILYCDSCVDNTLGGFDLRGDIRIEFGPYDQALCNPSDGRIDRVVTALHLRQGAGGGGPGGEEETYVPGDPTQNLLGTLSPPLSTDCVAASNLHYEIPWLSLTGASGARSGDPFLGEPEMYLDLPETVRAELATANVQRLHFERSVPLQQSLDFIHQQTEAPASTLRLWPEGLPFRLGPHVLTYEPSRVAFTSDGASGPPPYTPEPLDTSGLPNPAGQAIPCDPTKPGWTDPASLCTTDDISNGGYFASASWSTSGGVFDLGGIDVELSLPAGIRIVYETLFPRGNWVRLEGPATVAIADGSIASGGFDRGTGWLRISDGERCASVDRERTFALEGGALGPRIEPGGGLLAGVTDLTATQPLDWTINQAQALGCGTLWVPPPVTEQHPQQTWLASAVPTVLDRGIYAGYNYNRNRVCRDTGGVPQERFCATDADCDTAAGETCSDAGFSPLCPAPPAAPLPRWSTVIEGTPWSFDIDPDAPGEGDREMAFFARRSGISGVFDGGDDPFSLDPTASGFDVDFETFGIGMKQSRTEGADTITRGGVVFPWPSDTTFPFEEMEMCDCGGIDAARTPDQLIQNTLGYWNAKVFPYALDFTTSLGPNDECPSPAETACNSNGLSAAACITAITPMPRFLPDPTTVFPIKPNGDTGTFLPLSGPDMEFDRDLINAQEPYAYHLENFVLNNWPGNLLAPKSLVLAGVVPYGHYDASGDLSIPFFGLTPAGIQIQPEDRGIDFYHPANVHAEGGALTDPLQVERGFAADTILSRFTVDYFGPEATVDDDGDDRAYFGRGKLFAFADENRLDLGAVKTAGAMIMDPTTILHGAADLGPAASLRLWAATEESSRTELDQVMPGAYVAGAYPGWYDAALDELTSERPYTIETLPAPGALADDLIDTGAMDFLVDHASEDVVFNTQDPGGLNPTVIGERVRGSVVFSNDYEQVESFRVVSDQSSGGDFYAFDASLLEVDRHVKENDVPITTLSRTQAPGAGKNMALPGEQSVPFPTSSGEASGFFPGIDWDFDYDVDTSVVPPEFEFKSLTGTLDLTKGGLSGMGFDEMSATLAFYANGDWYFAANLDVNWAGYGINGAVLLGNTQDMTPLRDLDPDVAGFLSGVNKFDGAYIGAGISLRLFDYGCPFRVSAGADIAGWYIGSSYGGKVRGWLAGTGACLVSVRGDLTLLGGEVNDIYKIKGKIWVGGGIGFCDPEDWDTPADVLDDDFCAACVISGRARGRYPPSDLDLKFSGPDVDCSL